MARLPLVLVLATLIGAACGGGGSSSSGGGEGDQVAAVIKKAASSTDPADCTRLATQRFLDQSEVFKGKAAVSACRTDAHDASGNPKTTTVSKVQVAGNTAHAQAAFEGGNLDGQVVEMQAVKQAGRWKVDHIDSFVKFDRRRFLGAAHASFARPSQGLPPDAANCMVGRLDKLSDSEIQQVFLNADPARLATVFGHCIVIVVQRELAKQSVPKQLADCVVAKLDKPPYDALRKVFLGQAADQVLQGVAQDCITGNSS